MAFKNTCFYLTTYWDSLPTWLSFLPFLVWSFGLFLWFWFVLGTGSWTQACACHTSTLPLFGKGSSSCGITPNIWPQFWPLPYGIVIGVLSLKHNFLFFLCLIASLLCVAVNLVQKKEVWTCWLTGPSLGTRSQRTLTCLLPLHFQVHF
jgi:hypothetical protein